MRHSGLVSRSRVFVSCLQKVFFNFCKNFGNTDLSEVQGRLGVWGFRIVVLLFGLWSAMVQGLRDLDAFLFFKVAEFLGEHLWPFYSSVGRGGVRPLNLKPCQGFWGCGFILRGSFLQGRSFGNVGYTHLGTL